MQITSKIQKKSNHAHSRRRKRNKTFAFDREALQPAVSFGGKYRLVDIPISDTLNSGFEQIFVLTQFNSYSLNRHISRTYNFQSIHKQGFVEIIAAEQTVSSVRWFEGTADLQFVKFFHIWKIINLIILLFFQVISFIIWT